MSTIFNGGAVAVMTGSLCSERRSLRYRTGCGVGIRPIAKIHATGYVYLDDATVDTLKRPLCYFTLNGSGNLPGYKRYVISR